MAEKLMIKDVQLSHPRTITTSNIHSGTLQKRQTQLVDATISLMNTETITTFYIFAKLRYLSYEISTKTLSIGLYQPKPNKQIPISHFQTPDMKPILPESQTTISVSFPLVINQSYFGKDGGLKFVEIDTSPMQMVNCRVQYDNSPFRRKSWETSHEAQQRLSTWGTTIERRLSLSYHAR